MAERRALCGLPGGKAINNAAYEAALKLRTVPVEEIYLPATFAAWLAAVLFFATLVLAYQRLVYDPVGL
jgi:hypothetical protein